MTRLLSELKPRGRKSILSIVCAFALSILFMPGHLSAAASDQRFSQLLQQGKDDEAAGNLDEAIARYQRGFENQPWLAVAANQTCRDLFQPQGF